MFSRRDVIGSGLAASLLASPLAAAVRFGQTRKGLFAVASGGGKITPIYIDQVALPGVRRAAGDLAADIGRVTGTAAQILSGPIAATERVIIVGSLGHSPTVDALVRTGKLNVDAIRGKWEAFAIETVAHPMPGVAEALVIVGSDKRGAIYGIYDLSRAIGVSPWYWWADVPVVRRDKVSVAYGRYVQGSPAVQYRGIFLNDEAPCLSGWTTEKFGGMNRDFYGRLFELLLRLRANYLWPAMWNNAFAIDDPGNPALAEEYGIVMGSSHHEPMMRAHKEWTDHQTEIGNGQWNYATNRPAIREFFREGIARNRDNEVVVTIGMRGDGDVALESTGGLQSDIALLEGIIADQRQLIVQEMHRPAASVPQVWVLFTEVLKYFNGGLKLPDDVTVMFSDDNVGNLRRLPTPAERSRAGGYGIYFHMDMHGGPFSYQWINSNPLPKIWEQMNLALEYGADRIWIANVGDLKPLELPIEFFIAMAWNPADVTKEKVADWTRGWAATQFGENHADEAAYLLSRYAKYNAWCKPEQLSPATFSLEHFREAERVWAAWDELVMRATALEQRLRPDQRDAFFELVLYPVLACANLTQMYIAAARNTRAAEHARASVNAEAAEVRRRFARDRELSERYNHQLAGGKWDHMMDQTHIGYFDWYPPERNIMPAVTEADMPTGAGFGVSVDGAREGWPGYYLPPALPVLDSLSLRSSFLDVFARGSDPLAVSVRADQPWVTLTPGKAFSASEHDRRYWVEVDWARAPVGRSTATITVKDTAGGAEHAITVALVAIRATTAQTRAAAGSHGGLAGPFSFPATAFARRTEVRGTHWDAIPDYGREAAAMSVFTVTAASFTDHAPAPSLEYAVYFAETGSYSVDLITGPTLEVQPGRRLSVAVSLDAQPNTVLTVFTDERRTSEDFLGVAHADNARANARTMRTTVNVPAAGRHTLRITMVDPTIVIERIIVSKGALPASYFGPPDTGTAGNGIPGTMAAPRDRDGGRRKKLR